LETISEKIYERALVKTTMQRMVISFLDLIILSQLRFKNMSGYNVIGFMHVNYGILLSPGTVYSTIYSMERRGLIEGTHNNGRSQCYKLTEKGNLTIKIILYSPELSSFIAGTIWHNLNGPLVEALPDSESTKNLQLSCEKKTITLIKQ
jgi:DNA-binding PadR family transcriptional regulator